MQAADLYFHIAAEAVELTQVQEIPSVSRQYSRQIAPWCLDRPQNGSLGPKSFWGCAITAQPSPNNNAISLAPTNATIIQDMKNQVSDQHETMNFTSSDNVQFAVVGPPSADPSEDFKANSFAVSTTCTAIPQTACDVSSPLTNVQDGLGSPIMLVPFSCTQNRSGIDITGNLTSHNTKTHMLNFHKYATESSPFLLNSIDSPNGITPDGIAAAIQNDTADSIFRNPWSVLALRKIPFALQADFEALPESFRNDTRIWKDDLLGAFALMLCNVSGT